MSTMPLSLRVPVEAAALKLHEELVSFTAPESLEAEQYRALRQSVEHLARNLALKVLAVTSPGPGDGKTVTTLNLAGSLAQSQGARVLVIDADLHRPAIAASLGLATDGASGLATAARDDIRSTRAARRIEKLNLSVMLVGDADVVPHEAIASPRIPALLAEARAQYDFVLIDMPPAVPFADCRTIARWVDGFLLVVGAHHTPCGLMAEALGALDRSKIIGMVFNGDDRPMRAGYYGYYGRQRVSTRLPNATAAHPGPAGS
jgi:capsular exopolysaccharide synthesis family protein